MTADIVSLKLFKAKRDAKTPLDPVVAWWKCRVGVCLTKCGVTQTAIDTLAMFNTELRRRREKPITEAEVMVCGEHTDHLTKSRW